MADSQMVDVFLCVNQAMQPVDESHLTALITGLHTDNAVWLVLLLFYYLLTSPISPTGYMALLFNVMNTHTRTCVKQYM